MTSIAAPPQLPFTSEPRRRSGVSPSSPVPSRRTDARIRGLDEAVAHGLAITEVDHAGSVNDLLVWNPLDLAALIFEGEELVGAKQNRVLDHTVLVNAKSRTKLSVHCVERGRWAYRSERFSPAARAAHPTARYSARIGGQAAVWSEIAAKSKRLEAHSETEAAEFQGQQAPVVFFSMASSSGANLPRGVEFLFSPNRFNVAISRAQCLAYVVASPALLVAEAATPEQMRLVNLLCRFAEAAA